MPNWLYDVGTQAIAGLVSGALVGTVLLRAQHRLKRRLERERVQNGSRRELLAAAFKMYQLVTEAFRARGRDRVAEALNRADRAAEEWEALEVMRQPPAHIVRLSGAARFSFEQDLVAIGAVAGVRGREPSLKEQERCVKMSIRLFAEPLIDLLNACTWLAP